MDIHIDEHRANKNFLTHIELIEVIGRKNAILDSSVLISKNVRIGKENVLYPGVVIEQQGEGRIVIGDNNTFYPGTYIFSSTGDITLGNHNEFGPAGLTVKANNSGAHITVGDNGRYCDGVSIIGKTSLGTGSQILGSITVQNCSLADGGTFQESDPDKRAAVLKGFGIARNITLAVGQVVNGSGNFDDSPVERQSFYHPKAEH